MPRRPRSDWFSPPTPRIIAHRGLTVGASGEPDAPENTLLAFSRALDAGASHLETDARATSDGVAVLFHDPDLERIAGRGTPVTELSLAELQGIPLGADQRVCTLAELLQAFPGARINLDVKAPDAVEPVSAAIRDAGASTRVLVTSFSGRRRRAALRRLPSGTATSASSGSAIAALLGAKLGIAPLTRVALRRVDALQIPVRYGRVSIATRRVIRRLHAAGVEVHYWTVNDPAEMARLVANGADGIITDRADLAVTASG